MRYNPLLDELGAYPIAVLDRWRARVRSRGLPLFDFGTGDPADPTPAFIREAIRRAVPEVAPYPSIRGTPALRRAVAAYLARRFGVEVDPETEVLPTAGSKEAVFHLPLLVVDPEADDRGVVHPDPGYPAARRGALFAGGEAIAQPLGGDFLQRPWELPDEVLARTRLLWINSPHNPSGAVMDRDHLRRVWELCRRWGILLAADECYADLYLEPAARPPSLLEVAREGVVVLHSLSKRSGMCGYRSGFLAGDPEVVARLRRLRANPGLASPQLVEAGATAAWLDDDHVEERRGRFRARREVVGGFLADEGLELVGPPATFYLWARLPRGIDDRAYAEALLERGILVCPGSLLSVTGAGAGYVRVALAPSLESCREALDGWRAAHRALRRRLERG